MSKYWDSKTLPLISSSHHCFLLARETLTTDSQSEIMHYYEPTLHASMINPLVRSTDLFPSPVSHIK